MALKVFHCADLHLDAPFSLFTPGEADRRRIELRSAFTSAVLFARSNGADIFLISGDLFDSDCVTRDTCELLAGQFASFPTCRFFISPGNHDPYNDASVYKRMEWPDNVHIFTGEKERVRLDELGVDVYGVGFTARHVFPHRWSAIRRLTKAGSTSSSVTAKSAFRCPQTGRSPKPKSPKAALTILRSATFTRRAACCARAIRSTRTRAVWKAAPSMSRAIMARCSASCQRNRTGCALFGSLNAATSARLWTSAAARIRSRRSSAFVPASARYTEDTALRLTLTGEVADSFLITPADIGRGCEYPWHIEIIDKTLPTPDYLALERESTLRGVFYSKMKACIEAAEPDSEDYIIALNALKYGLGALNDRSINDFGGEG